jgi:hypothetical protein
VPVDRIRLGGGGARSALWRQIQADVYGSAVDTAGADEGAAYGAAILAAVGYWPLANGGCGMRCSCPRRRGNEPPARRRGCHERTVQAYTHIYPALRGDTRFECRLTFTHRGPSTSSRLDCGRSAIAVEIPSATRPRSAAAGRRGRACSRGRRVGRQPARQRPRADRRLPADRDRIVRDFKAACSRHASSCRWRPSTCSTIRCFATAPSPRTTRACAATRWRKTKRAMDLGAELAPASSCSGAGAKGPKPTRAAAGRSDQAAARAP